MAYSALFYAKSGHILRIMVYISVFYGITRPSDLYADADIKSSDQVLHRPPTACLLHTSDDQNDLSDPFHFHFEMSMRESLSLLPDRTE